MLFFIFLPNAIPHAVRSYLPEVFHFPILLSLNMFSFLIVIYFLRYAYKKKNAIIITLCFFQILQLAIITLNLFLVRGDYY
jgi:hypothetical protein